MSDNKKISLIKNNKKNNKISNEIIIKNFFNILDLSENSNNQEIRNKYKIKLKEFRDVNKNTIKFMKIKNGYSKYKNKKKIINKLKKFNVIKINPKDDWKPPVPGEPKDYKIEILNNGTIKVGNKKFNIKNNIKNNNKKNYLTLSFIQTINGDIYGFDDEKRNKFMCKEENLKKLYNEGSNPYKNLLNKTCLTTPDCCLYHGRLVQLLLDKNVIKKEDGILCAGKIKLDKDTYKIKIISNKSGHFMPKPIYLQSVLFILKQKIENDNYEIILKLYTINKNNEEIIREIPFIINKKKESKNKNKSDINFEKLSKIEYIYGEKLGKRFDYLQEQIKKGKTIIFPVYPNKNDDKAIKNVNLKMKKKYVTNLGLGIAIGKSSNTNSINKKKFEKKEKLLDEINEFAKILKEKYPNNVKFEQIKKADELKDGKFIQVWGANKDNRNNPEKGGGGQADVVQKLIDNNKVDKNYFYGIDTMSTYNEVKPTNNSTARNNSNKSGITTNTTSGKTFSNSNRINTKKKNGKNGTEICNKLEKHHKNNKKRRNNSNSSKNNNAFSIGLNKKIQQDLKNEEKNSEGTLRNANNLNNRERNSLVKKILFIRKLRRIFEYMKDKNMKFNNISNFNEKEEIKKIESLIDSNNNNS